MDPSLLALLVFAAAPTEVPIVCSTAEYFLGQRWVVFAPVRRGNTGAAESGAIAFTNTGKYIDDWAGAQPGADDARKFEAYRMQYLRFQKHDVDHALRWLAA